MLNPHCLLCLVCIYIRIWVATVMGFQKIYGKIGADGTGGRVEIEGFLKGPRGPKEIINIFQ